MKSVVNAILRMHPLSSPDAAGAAPEVTEEQQRAGSAAAPLFYCGFVH